MGHSEASKSILSIPLSRVGKSMQAWLTVSIICMYRSNCRTKLSRHELAPYWSRLFVSLIQDVDALLYCMPLLRGGQYRFEWIIQFCIQPHNFDVQRGVCSQETKTIDLQHVAFYRFLRLGQDGKIFSFATGSVAMSVSPSWKSGSLPWYQYSTEQKANIKLAHWLAWLSRTTSTLLVVLIKINPTFIILSLTWVSTAQAL